ncbi:MAG TPA: hypothetical protein VMU76_05435 [Acidimicrobiales bacterium]|nr:hypothetical protein [Acidimicrobiales bacterium]
MGSGAGRARRTRVLCAAGLTYAFLGLVAYWPIWPGDPHRMPSCACGDQAQQVWFLAWTPFALLHGHTPFLTNYIDFPRGANMAGNTLMSFLGLLGAPLAQAFGPVSALNLWLWLAFPLSATACFVLLRRWVQWTPAAFVGGLVYGFSPYMVGQGVGHLNLLFVPWPPLVLLLLDELVVRQRRRPVLTGVALGLTAAAEYLVASELFASTIVVAALGVLVLMLSHPGLVRARTRHVLAGVGTAAALCAAVIGYPVSVQLAGPDRYVGSAHGTYPFPADLLGIVVPTMHQLLAPAGLVAVSNRFIMGDLTENGSYLGIPLFVVLLAVVVWRWRMPLVRFAAAMAVAAEVLALGPSLTIDAHSTGIPLPVDLLDHLPLFASFVDSRFALYVDLFAAVLLAVACDQWHAAWRRTRTEGGPRYQRRRGFRARWWRPAVLVGVLVVALAPLVPDWPYPSYPSDVPQLFTSAALRQIPAGSVAMTYPYADVLSDQGMLWQASARMRFRLVGGYALVPGPDRAASYDAFPSDLASVPATFVADDQGTSPANVMPGTTEATATEVRRFLERYKVETVLADPVGARPASALSLLEEAIGAPTRAGGLEVWFGVQGHLRSMTP